MKAGLRIVLALLALLVLATAALLAWAWAPDLAPADVEKRWAQAPSTFIGVDGQRVHLRDEGPRDDPAPLVLVHGTSASLHTWDGWAEELRKTRRVIRFDLPGFGLTGPNAADDYSMTVYVRLVLALLDQLGVQRFVIGGNSLGGEVAWATAHAAPQRVEKLILVDAAGYAFEPESMPLAFRVARTPGLSALMGYLLPPGMVEKSVRNVYGDPGRVTPELVQRYSDLARRAGNRHALAVRMAQRNTGREQDIRGLQLPTLILWGQHDRLIPPVNGDRFAADIAGSQLVVFEGLGHVPQEEDPVATLAVVQRFLQR
ncbi:MULTISPECIES: alpha/beta fold hydrolase [unclassified Simplicispira]|uniref:alpha/beta fold hydrolase n=1 Tax=unclassified Simplicispira TaxID=2630407 RepID=UPI000D5D3113|nr:MULTISPECIES: alpha/beta hydrolase [unclassified Simplicispira]PVY57490.1 pimeloyl-ACP methyl ester carboxylesterase [Simplicispira sp. 125]REG18434.1 pimeloyl-ACP methyl ester carboxylesterase [Simplicispira sp. 110]